VKFVRPSHATIVAYLALFVALGGSAVAVTHLGKNSVGPKQLRKNAVTTVKIKKGAVTAAKVRAGSLTGAQIDSATLGIVPTAQTANAIATPEGWHQIGAPGEPGFTSSWSNAGSTAYPPAAFYKDHEGIVHLRGVVKNTGTGSVPFVLPAGYRPGQGIAYYYLILCSGGTDCTGKLGGSAAVIGPGFPGADPGSISLPEGALVSLSEISFRAEA
jgi:hypothetical protein